MIYKDKNNEIVLTSDLKEKIKDILKYHKDTINLALSKASNLDILDNYNENVYYIYNKKYNVDKKTTYINIPFDIFYNKDLSEADKLILSYCNSFVKKKKNCKINNKQIAKDLYISVQTVERSISKLSRDGFIKPSYEKSGFIVKKRDLYIDDAIIHNLFVKSIENLKTDKIENQTIKTVNNLKINTVENQTIEINKVDKLNNMNNVKQVSNIDTVKKIDNTFILSNNIELLEKLKSLPISKKDAENLYFEKKKEFELIKEIYNNSLDT